MCYQPGQDPFKENCPEHHNADAICHLPAGDTHIIYPSDSGPWMSIRLENHRESAEEYEMLKKHLSSAFQTKVQFTCDKQGKGKIAFPFKNEEELARLITIFDRVKGNLD